MQGNHMYTMLQESLHFHFKDNVRSNTRNVHPSAALQLKRRLCPHEGI